MIIAVNLQFKQLERRSLKKSGLQRDSNQWPPRYRCDALNLECRWSPDFFRLLLSNCLNWKFTAMIILHFHLHPQFKYELYHIYFTRWHMIVKMENPLIISARELRSTLRASVSWEPQKTHSWWHQPLSVPIKLYETLYQLYVGIIKCVRKASDRIWRVFLERNSSVFGVGHVV